MAYMVVTLDVSKLSGWLNADASCRVERRAHAMQEEVRPGRMLGGGDAIGVHGEGPTQGCGGQGTRGAHVEHVLLVCDAEHVEAERLVERRRELPSRRAGTCGKRCTAREARGR